jgi:hypothetical protein
MVDRHLGIPEGSTSCYHRTRQDLMLATAERIVELDMATVESISNSSAGGDVAEILAETVLRAGRPGHRERHLARCVMWVEATSNPRLANTMSASRMALLTVAENLLRRAGTKQPERRAPSLATFMNGLILGEVTLFGSMIPPEEVIVEIRAFLVDR